MSVIVTDGGSRMRLSLARSLNLSIAHYYQKMQSVSDALSVNALSVNLISIIHLNQQMHVLYAMVHLKVSMIAHNLP